MESRPPSRVLKRQNLARCSPSQAYLTPFSENIPVVSFGHWTHAFMLCYSRLVNRLKALSRKWNRVAKTAGIRFRLGPRFKVSRQTCLRWTAASCTFRQSHLLTLPSSARLSGNVRHSAAANTGTFANKDHHARIARRAMPAAEMVDFSFSDDRELQQLSAQVVSCATHSTCVILLT